MNVQSNESLSGSLVLASKLRSLGEARSTNLIARGVVLVVMRRNCHKRAGKPRICSLPFLHQARLKKANSPIPLITTKKTHSKARRTRSRAETQLEDLNTLEESQSSNRGKPKADRNVKKVRFKLLQITKNLQSWNKR